MVDAHSVQAAAVARAKCLLSVQTATRVPVAVLARHLGYSPWYFGRLFRRLEGQTISMYRERKRLARAVRHLRRAPDTELTYLALDLGYSSHSHFSSAFRRAFGVPPSVFAARVRHRRRYAIPA